MGDGKTLHINLHIGIDRRQLLVLLALAVVCASARELDSETLTMSTTYPSPSGIYQKLISTDQTNLARDINGATVVVGPNAITMDRGGNISANGNIGAGGALSSGGNVTAGGSVLVPNGELITGSGYVNIYANASQWFNTAIGAVGSIWSTAGMTTPAAITSGGPMVSYGGIWSHGSNGISSDAWLGASGLWSNADSVGGYYNRLGGPTYIVGSLYGRTGYPAYFVNVGYDDCGWGHPYLGCPAYFWALGAWHVGGDGVPGWCDGAMRGAGTYNGTISAGWMVLCVGY